MPAETSAASICGPPPWTITSSSPCEIAAEIACANAPLSSFMAWPPYLMTIKRLVLTFLTQYLQADRKLSWHFE